MAGFPNPYLETRPKSKGELTQEWASFFLLASTLLGLSFTETEKRAFAICLGALMRERKKFDVKRFVKFSEWITRKK